MENNSSLLTVCPKHQQLCLQSVLHLWTKAALWVLSSRYTPYSCYPSLAEFLKIKELEVLLRQSSFTVATLTPLHPKVTSCCIKQSCNVRR